eukprot:g1630.t1
MPYLQHHARVFTVLSEKYNIDWEWHIVEGFAEGRANAEKPYSTKSIFSRENLFNEKGLSSDGTTEYLTLLESNNPRIVVHRPTENNNGKWKDKIEMNEIALKSMVRRKHQCSKNGMEKACKTLPEVTQDDWLLLQLDADEIWTAEQILKSMKLFRNTPEKDCAFFHCHYFVTPSCITVTEGGYGHRNDYEWLRMWRLRRDIQHTYSWVSHAPPILTYEISSGDDPTNESMLRRKIVNNCFTQSETMQHALVFTHYSYVNLQTVHFKEVFYGIDKMLQEWILFQKHVWNHPNETRFALRPHLSWVPEGTEALCSVDHSDQNYFLSSYFPVNTVQVGSVQQHVVFDLIAFSVYRARKHGIWRVWTSVLPPLVSRLLLRNHKVTLLVRGFVDDQYYLTNVRNLPLPNEIISKVNIKPFQNQEVTVENYDPSTDAARLQQTVCNEFKADVFISTLYSSFAPCAKTRQVLLIHDMLPELAGWSGVEWTGKTNAMNNANTIITVSWSTLQLLYVHFQSAQKSLTHARVIYNRIDKNWCSNRKSHEHFQNFTKMQYLLIVGSRAGYKNGLVGIAAMTAPIIIDEKKYTLQSLGVKLYLVGGGALNEEERYLITSSGLTIGQDVLIFSRLNEIQLQQLMRNALALLYLSLHEGFGLPILEAMACGCPAMVLDLRLNVAELSGNEGTNALLEVSDNIIIKVPTQVSWRNENTSSHKIDNLLNELDISVSPKDVAKSVYQIFANEISDGDIKTKGEIRASVFSGWKNAAKEWVDIIESSI